MARQIFLVLFLIVLHQFNVCAHQAQLEHLIDAVNRLESQNHPAKDSLWHESQGFFSYNVDSLRGRLNLAWGAYYNGIFVYDSARMFVEEAVNDFSKVPHGEMELAKTLHFLAHISYDIEDIGNAVSSYHRALEIYEKLGYIEGVASAYNGIGNAYGYISEFNLSLSNYEKSIDFYKQIGDSSGVSKVLGNIGSHYTTTKQYDKALSYYEKSLLWSKNNPVRRLDNILGIGIVKEETKVYDGAEAYYREAVKLALEIQDYVQLGYVYQNLAFLYLKTNQIDSIPKYSKLASEIAEQYSVPALKSNLTEINHEYLYKKGEYQAAYELLKKVRAESDSFYNLDMTRQLQEVQAQYSTLKKEKELASKDVELAETNNELAFNELLRNTLFIGLVVVLFFVVLVYRSHKQKTKANELLQVKNHQIEEKNKQIQAIEESKTKWFINISHELRTPLTLIKGPIRQALFSIPSKDRIYGDLQMADRNISRLQKLVDEILDISKMEDGKMQLKKTNVNLTEMVLNQLANFDSAARDIKVRLEFDLDPEEPVIIYADRNKVRNVLTNLISNALKFTYEGGIVTVGILKEYNGVSIYVSDTGRGISQEDLPFIFDRFYQASHSGGNSGGTGIGLALCKEIATLHGGEMHAFSQIGEGSTFKLTLPFVKEENKESVIESRVDHSSKNDDADENNVEFHSVLKSKQVLIVDDNADMRKYISGFLKQEFSIVEARDGVEAVEKLRKSLPDIIISDVMMPRKDGIQLAKEVKEHPQWRLIPFITVSAIGDEAEKVKALRIGIDDYLVKPFYAEELYVRIQNLVRNYSERLKMLDEEDGLELSYEEQTLKKLEQEVLDNIEDTNFNVLRLADVASMSERHLYRFLKQMTGLTPANFVKEIRLQRAMELIEKRVYRRTSQISYAVGFQQPSYFSSVFKKRFGRLPAEYIED